MGFIATIAQKERAEARSGRSVTVLRNRPWPLLLAGSWLLQAFVRLALAIHQTTPVMIPDESGYLLAARLISGGAAADLSGRTFYQAGYSLLISPAFLLDGDPAAVYRRVIAINSLVSAALVVLAYIALRRLEVPRWYAFLLANVTALLPSVIYYAQFAMTDAVLPVVVLGWLLLVHSWLASGQPVYAAAASTVVAFAYTTHARGTIILLVHVGLLVVALSRRWVRKRDIAVLATVLAAGAAAGRALNGWVRSQIYPGGVQPHGDWLTDRLTSPDGVGWILSLTVGKLWYLIVSTWGVAGIGLVVLVLAFRRGTARPIRATAGLTLLTLLGIGLSTSGAIADEGTVANFAYGRYLACLVPVLFLAGAAFAWRAPQVTMARVLLVTAGTALAASAIVRMHAGDRLSGNFFSSFDFPEICFLTWNWDSFQLWPATVAALLLLALAGLVLIRYDRRRGLCAIAVAVIVLDLATVIVVTNRISRHWSRELELDTSLASAGLRAQDRVGVSYEGMPWRIWVSHAFQARNGLRAIDRYRRDSLPPDVTLVIVPWDSGASWDSWPGAPADWQPVSINRTPTGNWVAWRRQE